LKKILSMINYIMRLIRLSTTDKNLYFNNNIQADIKLSPKSKICCLNVNFEKEENELIISDLNDTVSAEVDGQVYRLDLTNDTYTEINYKSLLYDLRNSLQEYMDIGEYGTGYNQKAIGSLWEVSKNSQLKTIIETDQQPLIDPYQDSIGSSTDYENENILQLANVDFTGYTNDDVGQVASIYGEGYNFPTSLNSSLSQTTQGTRRCCIFTMSMNEINTASLGGIFGFMENPTTQDRSDVANYYLAVSFINDSTDYSLHFNGVTTVLNTFGNASNDDFLMFRFTDNALQLRMFNAGNPDGFDAFNRVEIKSEHIYPVLFLDAPLVEDNRIVVENLAIIPNVPSGDTFTGKSVPALTSLYNIPIPNLRNATFNVELAPTLAQFLGYRINSYTEFVSEFEWKSQNSILLYDNSENYLVELVNIDLQSYDGLSSIEGKKNLLMNIVNSRDRDQQDVSFVSTFPVWLSLDNAYETFIRNIKARIVHSDYREVKATGEANITLLIKDDDEE
tara:strand:+ start:5437 stop:6954 length:1518 start_codon:yes stop_codon:yes gene_type:complete